MRGRIVIEIDGLTKRYGDKTAVDGLSFVVEPGVVTGFLGPNGAGKSTTMRVIAGLDRPTSGTVRVNGKRYPGCAAPLSELGILLDAKSVHPGLSARNNLLALARTAGISRRRVDEVIELAGLAEVAGARAGGFSLGMGQRLGVAAALLGQPRTVVLDEPVNGLDPDGVRWIRLLLRSLAEEGRTVFLSSHLMSEMAQTATRLVILGRGKLVAETSVEDFVGHAAAGDVLVRTPEAVALSRVLAAPGVTVTDDGSGLLRVSGVTAEQIGATAWRSHLPVYELTPERASLEEAFMQVTQDSVEYHAGATR
jgi:ABC-2 type transport system ATP-binding protein